VLSKFPVFVMKKIIFSSNAETLLIRLYAFSYTALRKKCPNRAARAQFIGFGVRFRVSAKRGAKS
jgi:hypothetical protein